MFSDKSNNYMYIVTYIYHIVSFRSKYERCSLDEPRPTLQIEYMDIVES